MQDKDTTVAKLIEQGSDSIIIREGAAPEVHEEVNLNFSGVITSPSDYIKQRPNAANHLNSHAVVNKEKGVIVLVVDERDHFRNTITGQIKLSEKYVELGINTSKTYSPESLAKMLRLKRSMFPSFEDHTRIVATLRNVKAKVNQEMESLKENTGNRTEFFKQTVESNIPGTFEIMIPLIQGGDPVKIPVEIVLSADSGEIVCNLESIDAAEEVDAVFEKLISENVELLKLHTTVLFQ